MQSTSTQKLIRDVELFGRHGTDPVSAFLHVLREKHNLSDAIFLVNQLGYRTVLIRLGLNGRVIYTDRNLIEKWFHILKLRIDRFPRLVGGQSVDRPRMD